MTASQDRDFVLKGWHVLAGMLSFFAVVIAINVAFAVVAVQTFPGEDVTHPYLQGLNYNETVAERRSQSQIGWRAVAALRHTAAGDVLEVELRAREGAPLNDAHVDGVLRWPTDSRRDHALVFAPVAPGKYVARLGVLPEGRWQLRARATDGANALDFEADMTWPTAL